MDTLTFFNRVLASQGLVCLAEFNPGRKPFHRFYATHEEAAQTALELDAAGKTVYHACATFKTDESRRQDNAAHMRAFWIDADVDEEGTNPEKYPSLKEALVDIKRVSQDLNLPMPLVVQSGMGAHAYWILDGDVAAGEWGLVAGRLKSALDHLGFRQDRTRTADAASVLRPVGTSWRKRGVRPVRALCEGSPISLERFCAGLDGYEARVGASFGGHWGISGDRAAAGSFLGAAYDDLAGRTEYPPSSGHQIIKLCRTLAHIAGTRGNVEEPLWRAGLGVLKYTVESEQLCHDWSSGHPEYDELQTQEKIDGWTKGPTTCNHFRTTNGNRCAGCPHEVSSPIHLGYTEDTPAPVVAVPAEAGADEAIDVTALPHWPKGFFWTGGVIQRAVPDPDGGETKHIPFCTSLIYPTKRVRDEDGTWLLRVRQLTKDQKWREWDMPCKLLGQTNELTAFLASYEVFVLGKSGVTHIKDMLSNYTLGLQRHSVEQLTYSKFGWADSFGSFVIGNRRITATSDTSILPGEQIKKAGWDKDFGVAGSLEQWIKLVDMLYNRPGAEAFQFTIGCALAAPLVEITEASNWHGIPVALSGTTGLGKTTTCKVAASIYGNPENFLVAAGKDGATLNAMISRIGTARNLPVIFDELTDREPEEVSAFLYALSSGRPKDRNRADGTIIDLGLSWNTISFFTSNRNVTELLFMLDERSVTEATQIRVFEVALKREANAAIWGDTNAVELIEHQLLENYGHAGRQWLKYIIENRGTLKEEVRKVRTKYNPHDAENTRERYYRDLIATVVVSLKHAAKLGLVNFDLVAVAKWAKENTLNLRTRRHEHAATPEEYISFFLGSLQGRTIITKKLGDGRAAAETPLEPLRQAPVARMAIDDKRFIVSRKAFTDWCAEHRLQVSTLIDEMDKRAMIRYWEGQQCRKERLGRGTNIPSVPTHCYELVYESVINNGFTEPKNEQQPQT